MASSSSIATITEALMIEQFVQLNAKTITDSIIQINRTLPLVLITLIATYAGDNILLSPTKWRDYLKVNVVHAYSLVMWNAMKAFWEDCDPFEPSKLVRNNYYPPVFRPCTILDGNHKKIPYSLAMLQSLGTDLKKYYFELPASEHDDDEIEEIKTSFQKWERQPAGEGCWLILRKRNVRKIPEKIIKSYKSFKFYCDQTPRAVELITALVMNIMANREISTYRDYFNRCSDQISVQLSQRAVAVGAYEPNRGMCVTYARPELCMDTPVLWRFPA